MPLDNEHFNILNVFSFKCVWIVEDDAKTLSATDNKWLKLPWSVNSVQTILRNYYIFQRVSWPRFYGCTVKHGLQLLCGYAVNINKKYSSIIKASFSFHKLIPKNIQMIQFVIVHNFHHNLLC